MISTHFTSPPLIITLLVVLEGYLNSYQPEYFRAVKQNKNLIIAFVAICMWRVKDVVASFARRFPIITTPLASRYALHFARIATDALEESFLSEKTPVLAHNLACFYQVYHYKVARLRHLV